MAKTRPVKEGVSTAPDTGWCWMVLVASHVAFFLWEGLCKSLGVLLPTLTEQFDTETWPVGWAVGLMLAARGISGLVLGALERRWQHRLIAIVSGVLASVGVTAACFATNVVQFGLCLVLTGSACGLLLNCSLVILGLYFDRYYAMANGIACAGASLGILAFAPLTQFLLNVYGWSGCLLLIAGLFLHVIVVGALFRPVSWYPDEACHYAPVEAGYKQIGGSDVADYDITDEDDSNDTRDARGNGGSGVGKETDGSGNGSAGSKDTVPLSMVSKFIQAADLDLFASLSYVVLMSCFCNLCVIIVAWVVFTVPHVIVKGLSANQASLVAVAGALGFLTGQIGYGPLVDKGILGARAMMYIANFLMGATFLTDPWLDLMWPLIAGNFIFGVGFGVALPLSFTMFRSLVGGARMSGAVGWAEAAGGITRIIASFLTGWLYDRTGSYDLSFIIIGSMPCLVIVLLLFEDVWMFIQARKGRGQTRHAP